MLTAEKIIKLFKIKPLTDEGGFLNKRGKFALLGTTVSPGFDFNDFHLADRYDLLKKFPLQKPLITRLT